MKTAKQLTPNDLLAIKLATAKRCQGACMEYDGHCGKVKLYHVDEENYDAYCSLCEAAANMDRNNGYTVEEIQL